MDRSKRMLEMVRLAQQKRKQSKVSPKPSKINSPRIGTTSEFKAYEIRNTDYEFFKPIVRNELSSSYDLGIMDIDYGLFKQKSPDNTVKGDKDENAYKDIAEQEEELTSDGNYSVFDDSDGDPDFKPPGQDSDESDQSSETEEMAKQIEDNLESPNELNNIQKSKKPGRKENKMKRNFGQSYQKTNGEIEPQRQFVILKNCRNKCSDKISPAQQKTIFDEYWKLGNHNFRVLFVAGQIDIKDTKTFRKDPEKISKNRRFTCHYYLTVEGVKQKVCKTCFKNTLAETEKFIRIIVEKKINSDTTFCPDNRGKYVPKNKLPDDVIDEAKKHIQSFPAYESHYTRRDSSKLYLYGDLTIGKMYTLYCKNQSKPVSISKYSKNFKSLTLKFKHPKQDTCSKCDIFKAKIESLEGNDRQAAIQDQKEHHELADLAYKSKESDKVISKSNNDVTVLTFDLQQCLPTPFLQNSISFYKRQLWTFNLTVHDCKTNTGYCYMWDELTAKRGGNDIGSCLFRHLNDISNNDRHIILYSDSCPGQNKNSFIGSMFMHSVQNINHLDIIDHKFLVVGHSHMECDVDHSVIERAKKRTEMKIHQPRDWFQFVRTAGKKQQFKVIEMNQNDFKDFGQLAKHRLQWRKTDTEEKPFSWKLVRWLRYTKSVGIVQFKETLDEEAPFRTLKVSKNKNSLNCSDELRQCYTKPLEISIEKKKGFN